MDTLSPDLAFRAGNLTALAAWLALAVSPPSRRWTPWVWRVTGWVIPLGLAVAYVALLLAHWGPGGFGSLAEVRQLFDRPGLLAAGWLHYLAFDLFVGTWIARQAAQTGLPHWVVLPCFALTFMFGPAGLLAYAAISVIHKKIPSMNADAFDAMPPAGPTAPARNDTQRSALRQLWQREPRLVGFALLLLALLLAAALALGLDGRELRGVNVWVKPMKFMASVALLALTTAWFVAHLQPQARQGRGMRALVWTLIATGGFEVAYITLQAALGEASHYNVADPVHALMYTLMGLAALVLTATQPWLAWLLWRHGQRTVAPAYRISVLLGLVLTFVLGAGAGILLGGMQPPAGAGLPLVGWSRIGGDLRVAHFIGIHAAQVLSVIGFALAMGLRRGAVASVWLAAAGWTGLWAVTLAQALHGRPLIGV